MDRDEPAHGAGPGRAHFLVPAIPLLLLIAGLLLDVLGVLDWHVALEWARGYAQHWWLAGLLVAVQVVLYMLALPGSAMVWVAAPLYPPLIATAILIAGGSLGAIAAYWFARRLTAGRLAWMRRSPLFCVLERNTDFLALLGARLLPGFPHAVLNYGAGILSVPGVPFLAAAALGLGVKAYLYSSVIHPAVEAEWSELARPGVVFALLALVVLTLVSRVVRRRVG